MADTLFISNITSTVGHVVVTESEVDQQIKAIEKYYMEIALRLNLYRPCIISPIGIICNILIIIAFTKKKMVSSMSIFLLAIAVGDIIFLLGDLLDTPMAYVFKLHTAYCRFVSILLWFGSSVSDSLIVAVAVFRLVAIAVPHKAHIIASQCRSKIIIAIIFAIEFIFHATIEILTTGVNKDRDDCIQIRTSSVAAIAKIETYIALPRMFVLWVIIFISTLMIIRIVHRQRKLMQSMMQGDSNKETQMSLMLVTVCSFFLVNNLIYLIYYTCTNIFKLNANPGLTTWTNPAFWYILYQIMRWFRSVNHMANFFLYCISGSIFRSEIVLLIKSIFCHCRR